MLTLGGILFQVPPRNGDRIAPVMAESEHLHSSESNSYENVGAFSFLLGCEKGVKSSYLFVFSIYSKLFSLKKSYFCNILKRVKPMAWSSHFSRFRCHS